MLWTDAPHGAALSTRCSPQELAFWIGFALALGPPLGITRTVPVLLARPRTHQRGTRNPTTPGVTPTKAAASSSRSIRPL